MSPDYTEVSPEQNPNQPSRGMRLVSRSDYDLALSQMRGDGYHPSNANMVYDAIWDFAYYEVDEWWHP